MSVFLEDLFLDFPSSKLSKVDLGDMLAVWEHVVPLWCFSTVVNHPPTGFDYLRLSPKRNSSCMTTLKGSNHCDLRGTCFDLFRQQKLQPRRYTNYPMSLKRRYRCYSTQLGCEKTVVGYGCCICQGALPGPSWPINSIMKSLHLG